LRPNGSLQGARQYVVVEFGHVGLRATNHH
jgi:hypothetical protein